MNVEAVELPALDAWTIEDDDDLWAAIEALVHAEQRLAETAPVLVIPVQ